MSDERIADAARRYVHALRRREGGTGAALHEWSLECEHALTALLVSVGPCPICEDGATLEPDGRCDACGRMGACPHCWDDDCVHLTGRL